MTSARLLPPLYSRERTLFNDQMSTETIQVLKTIISDKKPALTADCIAFVAGVRQASMKDIAERHHITRQAVYKRVRAVANALSE
jgi:DNA-binding phage protein